MEPLKTRCERRLVRIEIVKAAKCRLIRVAAALCEEDIQRLLEDQLIRFAVRTGIEIDCAKIGMDFASLEAGFRQYDLCVMDFPFLEANRKMLEKLYQKNPDCLPVALGAPAERLCRYLALRPGGYLRREDLADGQEELARLCLACAQRISDGGGVLQFATRQGIAAVSLRSVLYCQSDLKYVVVVSEDGTRLRRPGKLNDLAALLPGGFVRVHQSFLVNRDRVRAVRRDTHELLLDQDIHIPYSRAYHETVMQLF